MKPCLLVPFVLTRSNANQQRSSEHGLSQGTRLLVAWVATVAWSFWFTANAWAAPATLSNPDWSIVLTPYGYADILLDDAGPAPGRELLSGEWAAAVRYQVGATPVSTTWLEPDFIAPLWTTNSNFSVSSDIAITGTNAMGLPIAESEIGNGDLAVHTRYEMIDTGIGIAQGFVPASAGGPGMALMSNRYIMQQTYTLENVSGEQITDLALFQFIHGLQSEMGVFDGRVYGGPFADFHFDTVLRGIDASVSPFVFDDVVAFHSRVAPSAFEIGHYGIIGTDSHDVGKPSVGTHLSIEADALTDTDFFHPSLRWIGGAQRYDLVDLAPGEDASFEVLLSINAVPLVVPEPSSLMLALTAVFAVSLAVYRRRVAATS